MKKIQINQIPDLLKSETITENQAVNAIWENFYTKPHLYGLENFDEDQKSDFLLEIINKIPLFLKNYSKTNVPFTQFLKTCLGFYKHSWNRKKISQINDESGIKTYMEYEAENKIYERNPDFEPEEINNKISTCRDDDTKIQHKIKVMSTLILTLKSCREIDDKLLKKVSATTEISEEELLKLIESIKSSTESGIKNREKLIQKRNKAFYYHRKYGIEISKTDRNSPYFSSLKNRYNFQTQLWIKSNKELLKKSSNIPSNNEIAKKLGLKPRTVGHYISYAKKFISQPEEEENS